MRHKLFTPLNVGSFELRHRVVVDWDQVIAARKDKVDQALAAMKDPLFQGGLMIFDPGPLIWPQRAPPGAEVDNTPSETLRRVIAAAKTARQTMFARLSADPGMLAPDMLEKLRGREPNDVEPIIEIYIAAARRARAAGFDGIELDGTAGTIIDFVLRAGHGRSDRDSGQIRQRIEFVAEIVAALARAVGRERVGVRLSPFPRRGTPKRHGRIYIELFHALHDHEIAYVHLVEARPPCAVVAGVLRLSPLAEAFRQVYAGIVVASLGLSVNFAIQLVDSRWADAICFSGAQLNARFLARLRRGWMDGIDA